MKSSLNDNKSILRSELAKKEQLVEELRKEIEVNVHNYCICVFIPQKAQSKNLKVVSQLLKMVKSLQIANVQ